MTTVISTCEPFIARYRMGPSLLLLGGKVLVSRTLAQLEAYVPSIAWARYHDHFSALLCAGMTGSRPFAEEADRLPNASAPYRLAGQNRPAVLVYIHWLGMAAHASRWLCAPGVAVVERRSGSTVRGGLKVAAA